MTNAIGIYDVGGFYKFELTTYVCTLCICFDRTPRLYREGVLVCHSDETISKLRPEAARHLLRGFSVLDRGNIGFEIHLSC